MGRSGEVNQEVVKIPGQILCNTKHREVLTGEGRKLLNMERASPDWSGPSYAQGILPYLEGRKLYRGNLSLTQTPSIG